jgi:predicted transcriptional regulator
MIEGGHLPCSARECSGHRLGAFVVAAATHRRNCPEKFPVQNRVAMLEFAPTAPNTYDWAPVFTAEPPAPENNRARRRSCASARTQRRHTMIPTGTINEILQQKGNVAWDISPDATVFEAIEKMAEKNIGALLVIECGKLVGIISERDYTRKVALKGKSSKEARVREILSGSVMAVTPNHSVEESMRLMTEHRIRHLPVLEGDKIAGVVSIGDLVNWIISAQSTTIRQLETYITGYPG